MPAAKEVDEASVMCKRGRGRMKHKKSNNGFSHHLARVMCSLHSKTVCSNKSTLALSF